MSSLVTGPDRSVLGKITRSGLDTRKSRPPASTIVASDVAMPRSSTARTPGAPESSSASDHAGAAAGTRTTELLQVALHRFLVARPSLVGICSGIPERPALPQQIPAAVELDFDGAKLLPVCIEGIRVGTVRLLAATQLVLLGDEPFDPRRDALVTHVVNATPGQGAGPGGQTCPASRPLS